jgi:hypothetical protein
MTSSKSNYLPKGSSPNPVTYRVMALTCELWRIQFSLQLTTVAVMSRTHGVAGKKKLH